MKQLFSEKRITYLILILLVSISTLTTLFGIALNGIDNQYNYALKLYNNGDYDIAYSIFKKLGYYKNSNELRANSEKNIIYEKAKSLYEINSYSEALLYFEMIDDYGDSQVYIDSILAELEKNDITVIQEEYLVKGNVEKDFIYLQSSHDTAMVITQSVTKSAEEYMAAPNLSSIKNIASDSSGKEYSLSELAEKKMVLSYVYNGLDVFFAGKLSKEGNWDGECLINIYDHGVLQNATRSNYENGIRKSYEQFFTEDNMCIYAKRTTIDERNYGDTWKYRKVSSYEQVISAENPSIEDFITPVEFKENVSTNLLQRYHGITQEGYYQDDTGNAYLISYYEDGTIRTLYSGCFYNGKFEDATGNAWYISSDKEKNVDYLYFKGIFKNGKPIHTYDEYEEAINDVSYQKIQEVVSGKPFEKMLNWDMNYVN